MNAFVRLLINNLIPSPIQASCFNHIRHLSLAIFDEKSLQQFLMLNPEHLKTLEVSIDLTVSGNYKPKFNNARRSKLANIPANCWVKVSVRYKDNFRVIETLTFWNMDLISTECFYPI